MSLRNIVLEAALWASTRVDVRDPIRCLRSVALVPRAFDPSKHDTVDSVIARRHELLEARGQLVRLASVDLSAGRLLAWEREAPDDDGVAAAATDGYLDASAMPPWDTWIAYAEQNSATLGASPYRGGAGGDVSCLVAWVPAPFVGVVDRAIGSHRALYWLRDSKLTIAEVLRANGTLV